MAFMVVRGGCGMILPYSSWFWWFYGSSPPTDLLSHHASVWEDNESELLQPLQKKGLKDVFHMLEEAYSFKDSLRRALKERHGVDA